MSAVITILRSAPTGCPVCAGGDGVAAPPTAAVTPEADALFLAPPPEQAASTTVPRAAEIHRSRLLQPPRVAMLIGRRPPEPGSRVGRSLAAMYGTDPACVFLVFCNPGDGGHEALDHWYMK